LKHNGFYQNVFFEAWADWDDQRLGFQISDSAVDQMRAHGAHLLQQFLVSSPDNGRAASVKNFSDGSERLRQRIEDRRSRHFNESFPLRRNIYSAILMIDEIELIMGLANKLGIHWASPADIGSENARRIIDDVPAFCIERELAVRLEDQKRPIEENDFRDMQAFCATIPYADEVVGEKLFVNVARQAKLHKKYGTRITTNILDLSQSLEQLNSSV
jgi:hypothetical protein